MTGRGAASARRRGQSLASQDMPGMILDGVEARHAERPGRSPGPGAVQACAAPFRAATSCRTTQPGPRRRGSRRRFGWRRSIGCRWFPGGCAQFPRICPGGGRPERWSARRRADGGSEWGHSSPGPAEPYSRTPRDGKGSFRSTLRADPCRPGEPGVAQRVPDRGDDAQMWLGPVWAEHECEHAQREDG